MRAAVAAAAAASYSAAERPWFTFHMDTAALTANIALAADELHEGGRLLALVGGEGLVAIERGAGEATVRASHSAAALPLLIMHASHRRCSAVCVL